MSRVLQEQKLAVSGLGGSEQALAVGMLLRVEVFAVLETVPGEKQPLGLVVFDAATGVRLHDAAFSTHDAEQTAQAIAGTIQSACAKRSRIGRADCGPSACSRCGMPICPARWMPAARPLRRCSNGADPLRRLRRAGCQRLEHVNKERTLPADSPAGRLMASLLTIDLEIGRGTDGKGLRAVALVHDAAGKRLAEARAAVPGEDIASLAAAIAERPVQVAGASMRPLPATRPPRPASSFTRHGCGSSMTSKCRAGRSFSSSTIWRASWPPPNRPTPAAGEPPLRRQPGPGNRGLCATPAELRPVRGSRENRSKPFGTENRAS